MEESPWSSAHSPSQHLPERDPGLRFTPSETAQPYPIPPTYIQGAYDVLDLKYKEDSGTSRSQLHPSSFNLPAQSSFPFLKSKALVITTIFCLCVIEYDNCLSPSIHHPLLM